MIERPCQRTDFARNVLRIYDIVNRFYFLGAHSLQFFEFSRLFVLSYIVPTEILSVHRDVNPV